MSLIKAYKNVTKVQTSDILQNKFLSTVDVLIESGTVTPTDVANLVSIYAEYSVGYIQTVAVSLEEPIGMGSTMKFMNSYIAEFVNEASLHYFDLEQGYSIVDKAVQKALEGDGTVSTSYVMEVIGEIEQSYLDKDEELED